MKKRKGISCVVCFLILSAVGMLLSGCSKEEGYRLMQVYQVEGEAEIERENVGSMAAYENLNLITGDMVNISLDSFMRLKVDEDKYILAEEGSVFNIYATGDDKNSKTDIQLEQGAITIEVQNKLSEDSSFEVTTPNSVMAVRGTVFRISAEVDENGKPITVIAILEGEVTVQKKDENGNLSEVQSIENGQEAIIYEESEEMVIVISEEIDMDTFPAETLEFLKEIATERRELCVTEEQLDVLMEQRQGASAGEIEEADTNSEAETDSEVETNSETDSSEKESDETIGTEPENNTESNQEISGNVNNTDNSGNESSSETTGSTEDESSSETTGGTEDESSSEVTGSTEDESSSEEIESNATYTVTFKYNGEIFGTQTVESGQTASEPKLMPAASGYWNFDFSTAITADTEIEFIKQ